MAGHSHWAGIKHKKAINDAKRGKVFSKLVKLLYSAVKEGGGPKPDENPRLRLILEKCRQANMPKDNVKRAIDKAASSSGGFQSMTFEGYGPGGVAVIIECLTDNHNRTSSEVKNLFEKSGGKLGKQGCVAHQFQRKGIYQINKDKATEERLMDVVLDVGAEDIIDQGDFFEVTAAPAEFVPVGEALQAASIETALSEIQLIPDMLIEVDVKAARKMMKLIDRVEDQDDVQNIYSNIDVSEEVAAELATDAG